IDLNSQIILFSSYFILLYNPVEKTRVHIKKVLASCNTFLQGSFVLFLFQLTISPMVLVQKARL
ncbi:TPA: hypothetical protein ACOYP9_002008, partial [Streptococcus pneumoniae]